MSNLLDNLNDVLNFAESLARMVGTVSNMQYFYYNLIS